MSYIGVKINSLIEKVAGMPLMDVAFSNRSTNGVQNKVIKAKFDEVESALSEDVSNKFGFGTVFTSISNKKMMLINNKILVFHIDGYNPTALPVAENSHFCTISDSDFLARIPSGNHIAFGWNDGGIPHCIMISKDSNGLAYTERTTSGFKYMTLDLVLTLN